MSSNVFHITADQIADLFPTFYNAKRPPMFIGSPGIAKTAFVREGAMRHAIDIGHHIEVRELHLASMSEVDVRGYLIPNGDTATFTKPEFWAAVEKHSHGVLFLDEFAQATHEVQKAVAPLLLEGRIGEYRLPAGWAVMLASNSINDNAGANTLLSHIINRVVMVNVKAPDVDLWCSWAGSNGMPFELIAFAKARPDVVFNAELPTVANEPYCTPRSIHTLGDLANAYPGGLRAMVESNAGMALVNGAIGPGAASEVASLVRMAINLPSYEDVVSQPERTPVPEQPAMAYAMVMLVAVRAQLPHADAVMKYLARFQPNFTLTGAAAMLRRDRSMAQSTEMLKWVMANREHLSRFTRYIQEAM